MLTTVAMALQTMGRLRAEVCLENPRFFFKHVLTRFFRDKQWEGVLFSLSLTKHVFRIAYVCTAFFFFFQLAPFAHTIMWHAEETAFRIGVLLGLVFLISAISLSADALFNIAGQVKPERTFALLAPLTSLALVACAPVTAPFFRLMQALMPKERRAKTPIPSEQLREKVLELLQKSEISAYLEANEQKLILSILSFKDRIVREVMVPRIEIFALSAETSIKEAAKSFIEERYSRVPVYSESVDNVVGVLFYKDLLKAFVDAEGAAEKLALPVKPLAKPILYSPETKKIAQLLQEFRNKQIHLAIVVNEWGGTEGIVTIEDVLEELVGEIADEFDIGQPSLYTPISGGGWIVDAKMSIVDVQEELGVKIPLSPEYDTIGGYVFHRAGSIPGKGWRIHHDDFDLEVLSSSERTIEKIKIIPH